jgi:outer membrane protein
MVKRLMGIILLSWMVALSGAGAAVLELAVGGWQQDPNGTVGYKALSSADLLDIDQDLKYDKEIRFQGRAKIELPLVLPNIYLVAAPSEFEAIGRKTASFKFGDQIFAGNVDFYSKLRYDQYDIGLYYGLPFLKTATADKLNVDLGINTRIFDVETQVRQAAIDEKESATAVIPLAYVAVQFMPVERLAFEAETRFMSLSGNTIYSLTGRVRLKLFGPAFVAGGYRYDKIDIDESDVLVDFDFKGPFAEVGLKF